MELREEFKLQTIPWRELFPWSLLFRSLPVAVHWPVLILAFSGVIATPVGWKVSQWLFVNTRQLAEDNPTLRAFADRAGSPHAGVFGSNPVGRLAAVDWNFDGPQTVFLRLVEPFWLMFSRFDGLGLFVYLLIGGVWTMLVWSLVGTAIARIAVVRYTRSETVSLIEALSFGWRQLPSCATALVLPLLGVFGLCVLTWLAGLLMAFDFGFFLVSVCFLLVIALAAVMALILLGLAFGWPLSVVAIAAEGQDSFDAMTRAYGYTFQRPLNYAFYALIAIAFGGICWLLVGRLTMGIEHLAFWSTSWGANVSASDRIEQIRTPAPLPASRGPAAANPSADDGATSPSAESVPTSSPSRMFTLAQTITAFWIGLLRSVAAAFLYAQFWCFAGAAYLLLRRDVDETELDEVFVSEEQRTFELPPLNQQPSGTNADESGSASRGEAPTQVHPRGDSE
jgi:hypothetical protein